MRKLTLNSDSEEPATRARKGELHFERLFFPGVTLLILASVFVGFARSYYLAGVFRAQLPNLLVHVHGAVFSLWIVLFAVQTSLIASGRVRLHKRLGSVGFGLAVCMVTIGLWTATNSMIRHDAAGQTGRDVRAFYAVPVSAMLSFSVLTLFGYLNRNNPAAHKRLVLTATVALLDAAFARWPIAASWWDLRTAQLCCYFLLLLLVCYDLCFWHKIHRATILGGALLIVLQQSAHLLGYTSFWQEFAAWAQSVFGFLN